MRELCLQQLPSPQAIFPQKQTLASFLPAPSRIGSLQQTAPYCHRHRFCRLRGCGQGHWAAPSGRIDMRPLRLLQAKAHAALDAPQESTDLHGCNAIQDCADGLLLDLAASATLHGSSRHRGECIWYILFGLYFQPRHWPRFPQK